MVSRLSSTLLRFFGGWLILVALFLSGCEERSAEKGSATLSVPVAAETITFGVYTADKASKVVEQFAPILAELEKNISDRLDRPVQIEMRVSPDYDSGINDLVTGEVDFSRLGPASFITAKLANPELELLAMESKGGGRTFQGIIAVHRDSPIVTLTELKGQTFAFGDPRSTIGRYLAQAELLNVGIRSSDFQGFSFLGRHDTVGMAVAAGEYTAGALKESTFKSLVESGAPLRALTTFENVTKPWVAHPSVAPDIIIALRNSFLEMDDPEICKDGFLPAEDSHYDPVKTAMNEAQAF